jgi:hypothetical protein
MIKYLILLLFCILCIGCGSAVVVNDGPKSDETMQEKEEGPTTTWTITVEPNTTQGCRK